MGHILIGNFLKRLSISGVFFCASIASADSVTKTLVARDALIAGDTLAVTTIEDVVAKVRPGGVLVVSEEHGNQSHYARQKQALRALATAGQCTVSVGLEFLPWKAQSAIDSYFSGALSESDFLIAAEWGSNPFADYRDQALFPRSTGGKLLGLNASRALSGAVAKKGLAGLDAAETAMLPAGFTLGNAEYRERFEKMMAAHVPPSSIDRYFAAQSLWDESMASVAAEFLRVNQSHCLVIVVGDFHAAWGGGLPDRLRARGVASVVVVSQFAAGPMGAGMSNAELAQELGPNPRYGMRADAIGVSAE